MDLADELCDTIEAIQRLTTSRPAPADVRAARQQEAKRLETLGFSERQIAVKLHASRKVIRRDLGRVMP